MWHTFLYTLKSNITKSVLIWVIIFPIVLSTMFAAMFSHIESEAFTLDPVSCAVVENAAFDEAGNAAFGTMIDTLNADGDNRLIDVTYVDDTTQAEALLSNGDILGYYVLDDDGNPSLMVSPVNDSASMDAVDKTVLADIANEYIHSKAAITDIAERNPMALADATTVQSLFERIDYTSQVSITANPSAESVRYFYALLGFAALMAAMIGLQSVVDSQANLSPVGARRAIGGISRGRVLAGALLGSWALSFGCLLLAFAYMRFVLGINFGGRDLACILGLAVASLMATALGALIGSIPKMSSGAKGGLLTGITCTLSLFSGLYGSPSLTLADQVAQSVPWLSSINPAKGVADLFYSLYFYTSYDPFIVNIVTLLGITAVLTIVAALFMRRQRYASL